MQSAPRLTKSGEVAYWGLAATHTAHDEDEETMTGPELAGWLAIGVIACAIWDVIKKLALLVLVRAGRYIAPRLGKRVETWYLQVVEYSDELIKHPTAVVIHHIKWLELQSILNWATIVAMTGLVIYSIHGSWTMLSGALFIVGLLYYTANYCAKAYQIAIFSIAAARYKALTAGMTPAQRLKLDGLAQAQEIVELLHEAGEKKNLTVNPAAASGQDQAQPEPPETPAPRPT